MVYPEAAALAVSDKVVTVLTKRFLVSTRYAYKRYEKVLKVVEIYFWIVSSHVSGSQRAFRRGRGDNFFLVNTLWNKQSGIFRKNGSKNSILNWVMKLSLFMFFVFFFGFETPLKDFQFYSYILLTLRFRYLQTRIKESCIYLSGQIFFKSLRKIQEKCFLSADLDFKNFNLGVSRSHWTKQAVKKLNLWGRTAVDRSAFIIAWQ